MDSIRLEKKVFFLMQLLRLPSSNISIDEGMITYTDHSSDTYKMPSEPIELGFKFHCLADYGYIWDFHPTSNSADPNPVPSIEGLTSTGEIQCLIRSVCDLTQV